MNPSNTELMNWRILIIGAIAITLAIVLGMTYVYSQPDTDGTVHCYEDEVAVYVRQWEEDSFGNPEWICIPLDNIEEGTNE